ncbi:NAD-dependent epimerase/dehydratase family protein [Streptomyces enissocaesilis]|uniref:UDP-glucose 4-epimerase n=1 Tax=Streptomyces enissocaesilis TaxID=332589 RepID=A0ABN3X8Y7_9ACTN
MRVLITGGAGFIGSHLTEAALAAGHDVRVIDDFSTGTEENLAGIRGHARFALDRCDITTPEAADVLAAACPEVVLHLAAQASVQSSLCSPLHDARTNVLGTLNILDAAARCGTRKVVFASSGGTVYGQARETDLPLTERLPKAPESFYGLSKHAGQEYLRLYSRLKGIEHASLALGNVYGPRQDPHGEAGVVGIFTHRVLRGQTCTINGDGETTRDYVFVTDVVDAFLRAIDRGEGMINIGTGAETSVNDVLRAVGRAASVPDPAHRHDPARPGEVRRISLSPRRARRELDWTPEVPFATGIAHLVAHLRQQPLPAG